MTEYLNLWNRLSDFVLQPEVEDSHTWQLSSSEKRTLQNLHEGLFIGAIQFQPWERIWKNWAPGKCKFFMWLVANNKCWTTHCLTRRGLAHLECCPLCDQVEETIDHLLVSCVYNREVWFHILQRFGLQPLSPRPDNISSNNRWASSVSRVNGQIKKRYQLYRNFGVLVNLQSPVFDGITPTSMVSFCSLKRSYFYRIWLGIKEFLISSL